MMDKADSPNVVDGYGLSLAFLCMLDIVKCVQNLIPSPPSAKTLDVPNSSNSTVDETINGMLLLGLMYLFFNARIVNKASVFGGLGC